jgi:hypothetical protein
MFIASYYQYNPETKGGLHVWEPCPNERLKPFMEKLQKRVDDREIKDCVIFETPKFFLIEKKSKKK